MSEGWMAEKPNHIRRYHYIVETRALCGGYGFYTGDLSPVVTPPLKGREDCAECFKRLLKRKTAEPNR